MINWKMVSLRFCENPNTKFLMYDMKGALCGLEAYDLCRPLNLGVPEHQTTRFILNGP